MQVRSWAKINWALRILGRRADGFHDLETLFQTISLHDEITIDVAPRLALTCDDPTIPTDETNLVLRAARALNAPPVSIHLHKRVPSGGGLGGGSSNAAATLVALDRMFDLKTPPPRMREIAVSLGSDVPFFLAGGLAYATSKGEELTQLRPSVIPLLLVLPEQRISTAEAFAMIDRYSPPLGLSRFRAIAADLFAHAEELTNDFEDPIFIRMPALRRYKHALLECGAAWAAMSGSGSTVVGAFRDTAGRDAALSAFEGVHCVPAETLAS
jgi:4-diphosphocytidyl-2-C-methyl-D-erythritol kinase